MCGKLHFTFTYSCILLSIGLGYKTASLLSHCSGPGWSSVDPVCASDLQARVSEGEFWLDEAEFVSQFDDITVGYPINKEGHLKSIYTGY